MPAANKTMVVLSVRLQRKPVWRGGLVAIKPAGSDKERLWTAPLPDNARCNVVALAGDVVLAAVPPYAKKGKRVVEPLLLAFSAADGKELWRFPLPGAVLENGLTVDRDGRVIVVLRDGRVLCLAGPSLP